MCQMNLVPFGMKKVSPAVKVSALPSASVIVTDPAITVIISWTG